jgi:all-trans-retinol 13,14-reductase
LTKGNRAIGVETHKGQKIYAPLIISNAGVFNTFSKLVDPKLSAKLGYLDKLKRVKPSVSHFYLFLGMNKSSKQLNLPKYNIWYHPTKNLDDNDTKYKNDMDFSYAGCFISFPSSKDPTYDKRYPNKSTCIVVCEAKFEWVKEYEHLRVKQRGTEYNSLKKKIMAQLEAKAYKVLPQIKDHVVFKDVGTPVTNSFYLASVDGASYGLEFTEDNADWLRSETKIENLYLTGQDITTMGFSGAIGGAAIAFTQITGDKLIMKLKNKQ